MPVFQFGEINFHGGGVPCRPAERTVFRGGDGDDGIVEGGMTRRQRHAVLCLGEMLFIASRKPHDHQGIIEFALCKRGFCIEFLLIAEFEPRRRVGVWREALATLQHGHPVFSQPVKRLDIQVVVGKVNIDKERVN